MKKVYVPATDLNDWRKGLGNPDTQWRDNYSAKLTAEAWHDADGFPSAIARAFQDAGETFNTFEPLLIFPEHQVPIPPLNAHPTQTDVWVLAAHEKGLASIAVEGKKEESFGPTLDEWLVNASEGKQARLAFLTQLLGLPSTLPGAMRYQFLHRAASAVIEARRFRANIAMLLIQSFSDTDAGLPDYHGFTTLFGSTVQPGAIALLSQSGGISLYTAWIRS
jgi:hypothetical protein